MAAPNDLSWLANLPGQQVASSAGVNNPNASGNQGQADAGYNSASQTDPDFVAHLNQLKQYDPNASITTTQNSDGQPMYGISYDQSKLPKVPTFADGQQAARPGNFAASFQNQMDTGGGSPAIYHHVIDPSQNVDSPYGQLTPSSNVTTQHVPTKPGLLDTIGPLAVGAAAFGLPALFSGLPGAGLGAAGELAASAGADVGAATPWSTAATTAAKQVPGALNSNSPFQTMVHGLPSWVVNLLKGGGGGG